MLINVGEVVNLALANALAVGGRWISAAISGRRRADDFEVARWFETYKLTSEAPELQELSPALTQRLVEILRGDEAQAALQVLLTARLTDAPEMDAARARRVLSLTLIAAGPEAAGMAEALADYYDEQICSLVARLEGERSELLHQIRNDAFSTRMIAILGAIERHTAALVGRPDRHTEVGFVASYRRHVVNKYGMLEPPDFQRRRRIPISDIYVPTLIFGPFRTKWMLNSMIVQEGDDPDIVEAEVADDGDDSNIVEAEIADYDYDDEVVEAEIVDEACGDIFDLPMEIDRSVLLGDPGGGKTTAAHVLMHHYGSDEGRRIPFLVTLRQFAAEDPPERSVVRYIEHNLDTLYQCPPPPGLVDLMLLTGHAVVIFDGLDELIDTSRRADVTTRVEQFCVEYPLTHVLVTSRLVGYRQAPLDDREFICYELAGFNDNQIEEYARKWFDQDPDAQPRDAEAFLTDSDGVPDLRCNPLMLALLCILYRGEGSLPRERADVFEQCANLLFRKWDGRRKIYLDLRADRLLEPALRHLAWWLFAGEQTQTAVTERQLIIEATAFLHGRGFESENDARDAAREFVEFCRGRMWVFSDIGTTATGEILYAFTHRTFLEYFAAARLAYDSDTPEEVAIALVPHVTRGEWWTVAELAVQIKDNTSKDGASRIYAVLLDDRSRWSPDALRFLALCLRSANPSPQSVKKLTRQILQDYFAAENIIGAGDSMSGLAESDFRTRATSDLRSVFKQLVASCGRRHHDTVADEIDCTVAELVESGDPTNVVNALRLVVSPPDVFSSQQNYNNLEQMFWESRMNENIRLHSAAMVAAAETDAHIRLIALRNGLISTERAMSMTGGPSILFKSSVSPCARWTPFFGHVFDALAQGWPAFGEQTVLNTLSAYGRYLLSHPEPPWLHGRLGEWNRTVIQDLEAMEPAASYDVLSDEVYLAAAVILFILAERTKPLLDNTPRRLGPLIDLHPYLSKRKKKDPHSVLPDLPVPDQFKQQLRDWAERRVNFTAPR